MKIEGQIVSMPLDDYSEMLDERLKMEVSRDDWCHTAEHWQERYASCRRNLTSAIVIAAALGLALLGVLVRASEWGRW